MRIGYKIKDQPAQCLGDTEMVSGKVNPGRLGSTLNSLTSCGLMAEGMYIYNLRVNYLFSGEKGMIIRRDINSAAIYSARPTVKTLATV